MCIVWFYLYEMQDRSKTCLPYAMLTDTDYSCRLGFWFVGLWVCFIGLIKKIWKWVATRLEGERLRGYIRAQVRSHQSLPLPTQHPSAPWPLGFTLVSLFCKGTWRPSFSNLGDMALATKVSVYHQVVARRWIQLFLMVCFTRQRFHASLNSNSNACAPFLIYHK